MNQLAASVIIGLLAGILGGIFGIGGGILIVPALIYVFGFTQLRAQGTSLVALLAPVGLFGLMEYYKKGEADFKVGGMIALGFLLGAFFGSKFALNLPEVAMRKGFACFLIAVGILMFVRK